MAGVYGSGGGRQEHEIDAGPMALFDKIG